MVVDNLLMPQQHSDDAMLHCSGHPCCQGPRLRPDHDRVCSNGDECDDDYCWRGCIFCVEQDRCN